MKKPMILSLLGLCCSASYAQEFNLDMELRPRVEYRHGYNTLIADDEKAATFVSQRSRLNFGYESERLQSYISLQNVRVWGDVNTVSPSDNNGTALHEAWAAFKVDHRLVLKMGRQEIVYDDQRIFGNVDWGQAARSHDAFIAQFTPNKKHRLDLGLALNASKESNVDIPYNLANYKAFQYLWYQTQVKQLTLSFLALNTVYTYEKNATEYNAHQQIFGSHLNYKKNKISANASVYAQTGHVQDNKLSAFNIGGVGHYQTTELLKVGLGIEYFSGTDMNTNSSTLKHFNPLFGTNHKFNGWMDYFHVGNSPPTTGLLDLYMPIQYQKQKLTIQFVPHVFSSTTQVVDILGQDVNNYLGTELDMSISYAIAKDISFSAGYSHLFASETMGIIKGSNPDLTQNWAWAMFVFKPQLFKYTSN